MDNMFVYTATGAATAALAAYEQEIFINTLIAINNNKEYTQMDIKMLDEIINQEVSITVVNQLPVKGKVVEISDSFIKVETAQKNFKNKVYYLNKNLITTITIK